jgi:hypothetical protein
MARRKKQPTVPSPPPKAPARCFRCDGSGEICAHCGEAEGACECAQGDDTDGIGYCPDECPDCKGTGK